MAVIVVVPWLVGVIVLVAVGMVPVLVVVAAAHVAPLRS